MQSKYNRSGMRAESVSLSTERTETEEQYEAGCHRCSTVTQKSRMTITRVEACDIEDAYDRNDFAANKDRATGRGTVYSAKPAIPLPASG